MTQSEGRWGDPCRGAEARRELLRTAEPGSKRDFGHGVVGLNQPALGFLHAQAQDEAMRRHSGGLLKCAQKMPLAETDDTAHRGERQSLGYIVAYIFLKLTHPTRRQWVAQQFPFDLAAANDPGKMRECLVRPAIRKELEDV